MKTPHSPDHAGASRFFKFFTLALIIGTMILGLIIWLFIKYKTLPLAILLVLVILFGLLAIGLRSMLHNERKRCHCQIKTEET